MRYYLNDKVQKINDQRFDLGALNKLENHKEKILVVDDEASIRRILETRLSMIGYDVVTTSGSGYHATVVVPEAWGEFDSSPLTRLFEGVENPRPRKRS